jgi:nicotinamide-nucleotide amidase
VSVRAGIVVTGTEVLSGIIRDENGPWLSERLRALGVSLAHVMVVGDRPADLRAALEFLRAERIDLVITTGGLGPTADDLTAEVVAEFAGLEVELDEALEGRIWAIISELRGRWRDIDEASLRAGNRKQALVPRGAIVMEPVGTAPGLVVAGEPVVVVLPGPPRELQSMWREAVATDEFRAAVGEGSDFQQSMLRLFGIPESEIAETLRVAERSVPGLDALEVTTCLRGGEVEVVVRHEPSSEEAWEGLRSLIAERHADTLFSMDGTTVDEQVASLLSGRWAAVAESCTGGLLAARLTRRAGSSEYFAGGIVSYSNDAKSSLLGVDPGLIAEFGAVSPQVADAMALGALSRFEADTAVAITGVAGPGGGTEAKPVGYVCWSVKLSDGTTIARDIQLPGDRAEVRDRATAVAMHLLRRALRGERSPV